MWSWTRAYSSRSDLKVSDREVKNIEENGCQRRDI